MGLSVWINSLGMLLTLLPALNPLSRWWLSREESAAWKVDFLRIILNIEVKFVVG